MDVHAYLAERTPLVDALLERLLPDATTPPALLHGAMRHLVFPAGKRLRPAFAMAGAEAVGAPPQAALPMAAAVELVHTYSLIHDDLPCMDDDVLRRGRATVHVAYDAALAVLAGDALQALAFESLARESADPRLVAGVVRDLAVASGAAGLVGGQADDLAFAESGGGADAIESIHARKSAALIAASVVGGARLGGASEAQLERLARFGRAVGVAFQIADDLLDQDDDAGCTLLQVLSPEAARARAEALLGEALTLTQGMGEQAEPLRELARYAVRRRA